MNKIPKTPNQKLRESFGKRFLKELKQEGRRMRKNPPLGAPTPILNTLMRMK